jgi:hypothetical protein
MLKFGELPPEKIEIELKQIKDNLFDPYGLNGKWHVNFHDINNNWTMGISHGYLASRYGMSLGEISITMRKFNPTFGKAHKGMGLGYQEIYFKDEKTGKKVVEWLESMELLHKIKK